MLKPTPAELRLDTRIDWVALGFPETVAGDALLASEIDLSWAYVNAKTCLDLSTLEVGSDKAILASQALKLRTVQGTIQGSGTFITQALSNLIQSFAVPGYSETRFGPQSSDRFSYMQVNGWPVLADLLWAIMGEECRQGYIDELTGENAPFSSITQMDWPNSVRRRSSRSGRFFE